MPERIYKLQPDRTLYLRGFNSFAAAASIHSASPTGFQVSGTFRDQADFAVAVLYDADNYYEHPSIKYLPDFDFAGLTLNFSLNYTDGLQPIDSPKYNWIDWATLDCIRADGTTASIRLFDNAMLAGSVFPAAAATFNVISGGTIQPYDRVTLWFQNIAFDYIVPGTYPVSAAFEFYAGNPLGTIHSIVVNGRVYSYPEGAGDSSANVAADLIGLVNAGSGDVDVVASAGSSTNAVSIGVRPGREGNSIALSASDGNAATTIFGYSPTMVAAQLVADINVTNWILQNTTHAVLASNTGAQISLTAAQYGTLNASGTSVTWVSGTLFSGITAGSAILIGGTLFAVASVQSPTALTLALPVSAPVSGAAYVAPRGGRDGNMIELYGLGKNPATLSFDQTVVQLSGGSSAVTWNCTIDFTALGIDSLRQCWLTFAPSLADGTAYTATEWLATFSNWALTGTGTAYLQVAGPGSVRIEENDTACKYTGAWSSESGFYSKYFAYATSDGTVTVTYRCQLAHDLYVGTSLYTDRAVVGVELDGVVLSTTVNCVLNTSSAVVTRRLVQAGLAAGAHSVTFSIQTAGVFYFDFLEAAVLSDVPDAPSPRTSISPALDFDTNHSYTLPPARIMWIMDKLGYGGPMNEYLGVFWWNQRIAVGNSVSNALVAFSGAFVSGDLIVLTLNSTVMQKNVYPADTLTTIANHFAVYINETLVGAWASASAGNLTIQGRSPDAAYNLTLAVASTLVAGSTGVAAITQQPQPGVSSDADWIIDDTASPPINRATRDWHADYYAQCASRGREVVTSCSLELVNPPAGYSAMFPNGTEVSTSTGFGDLNSTQCAVGASKVLAYQKAVYRTIAQMQTAAGLTPCVQYGEFLWWYFANAGGGMGYYDAETTAAALAALGRALYVFETSSDDPSVNGGADAVFLRDRLRDHVGALVSDIRGAYPTVICEVLFPYDVNYPSPLTVPGGAAIGGRLNYFVNLPVEWEGKASSGLDRIKAEALAFASSLRNLDLASQAINLFPGFGWPLADVRYLVPVFGSATPWYRELGLVWAAGLKVANFWAFDHVCLFNLEVPEPILDRRSFIKTV